MAGNIKGITIEFNGEDKGLKSVMRNLSKDAKSFDTELRQIDKSLKFNPNNVTLMGQKLNVLTDAAQNADKRVKDLKDAQAQLDAQNVDKNSKEYRELEREIIKAENQQKNYNKELNKLKAAMSPLGQASAKMKSLGDAATKAGNALKGVSMAAAGIDVALGALAYKSGAAADDLNTMAKVTGISTQELQKYKAAADLVDVSVETIAKSQTKMKKSMLSAQQGSKNMEGAFKTLGVSVEDSNGHLRSQDEVFTDVISALGKMQNETERDALAMQIFGKSASELNPLIEDNGETYKMVADIFKNNNLELVDQETIDKANAFNDEIDKIKATWGAALQSVGMQLAGYLAPAMEKIGTLIQSIAGWLSQLDPAVLTVIGIIAGVVAALAPVLIIVGKVATGISAIMSLMSTLGVTLGALAGPVGIVIGVIAALIAIGVLLYKNWDKIKEYAGIVKDWVVKTWTQLKTSVTNIFNAVKTTATTVWTNIKTTITNIVTGIKTAITNAFTSAKNTVSNIFNTIRTIAVGAWTGIKYAITHPIDAAVLAVKLAIAKIKSFFSGLKLQLPHIKLPHFKLSGKLSLAPPSVPKLSIDWYKNGGIFTQPTIFGGVGVGEAGAEAVLPLKKLWSEMDKRFNQPSIVINVNAPQGMDVNELAAEVERRLINSTKRRKQAWA